MSKENEEQVKSAFEKVKAEIENRLKFVNHKIAILSNKGGVGKTTVAVNLAAAFVAFYGMDVALLDVDVHGPNVPKALGLSKVIPRVDEEKNLIYPAIVFPRLAVMSMYYMAKDDDPIVLRGPLKTSYITSVLQATEWGRRDVLIADCPPGTGDEILTFLQEVPVDGLVIVTAPDPLSELDVKKAISFGKMLEIEILGIIENMSYMKCPHCDEEIEPFGKSIGEEIASKAAVPFLGKLPFDPNVSRSVREGKPFVLNYLDSPAAKEFEKVTKKILSILTAKEKQTTT
ncbi:MAG: P-loop NTPase [Candidatus Sifarchaeia archaeon]|jgi:Mrp family chromosome partitioning ATPase